LKKRKETKNKDENFSLLLSQLLNYTDARGG